MSEIVSVGLWGDEVARVRPTEVQLSDVQSAFEQLHRLRVPVPQDSDSLYSSGSRHTSFGPLSQETLAELAWALAVVCRYEVLAEGNAAAGIWAAGLVSEVLSLQRGDGSFSVDLVRWPFAGAVHWDNWEDFAAGHAPPTCAGVTIILQTALTMRQLARALPAVVSSADHTGSGFAQAIARAAGFIGRQTMRFELLDALAGTSACANEEPFEFLHAITATVTACYEASAALIRSRLEYLRARSRPQRRSWS